MTSAEPTCGKTLAPGAVLVPAIVEHDGGEVALLAELAERARAHARSSKAPNTLRAYESDLRHFGGWSEARGLHLSKSTPPTGPRCIAGRWRRDAAAP